MIGGGRDTVDGGGGGTRKGGPYVFGSMRDGGSVPVIGLDRLWRGRTASLMG
jgi:hypothetical protein